MSVEALMELGNPFGSSRQKRNTLEEYCRCILYLSSSILWNYTRAVNLYERQRYL